MKAFPASSAAEPKFDLSALSVRSNIVTVEGRQQVLLRGAKSDLHLTVIDGSILRPVRLSIDALWPVETLRYRLDAIMTLNHFVSGAALPVRLAAADPRSSRLRFVLQALDGSLAGASHREIAIALLGEKRVDTDWSDPGAHLQDRIRRAIKRGRELMRGGYLSFLR